MQVTKEGIERIRAANDLAGLLAERGIGLSRKGRQLVALCPFHKEKTPSFSVSKERGLYRCFGCGASGDIIGFITKYDKVSFPAALESLARRAGLDLADLMEGRPRKLTAAPAEILTHPSSRSAGGENGQALAAGDVLARVVEQYHRTFCSRPDAQEYLRGRGLRDLDLLRALKIGYADGSLLKAVPKDGPLRAQLVVLGVITSEGRELLGGCLVVPIPDPLSGGWTSLYGRGLKTDRHCYLPGPLRGVLNFQAARCSSEVILTESILDALSFHQAGIGIAIPIYGTNGFTPDHLDLFKRERVERVILALDSDDAGQKATDSLKEKLTAAGLHVRTVSFPAGIKDANQLLVSKNGDAGEAFRVLVDAAMPKPAPPAAVPGNGNGLLDHDLVSPDVKPAPASRESDQLVVRCEDRTYRAKVYPASLGRLRATVKVEKGAAFHVDTIDLYSSRSRAEFARRASKALAAEASALESDLLALLVDAERAAEEKTASDDPAAPPPLTESERAEGLSFLKRSDLLDQVAADIDALGYVGEETNTRLAYLIAISRKLPDPLSAVILSQSGAGKSGLTEAIERLTPPEDVVLLTRLTPQSLYYTAPGFLDQKLVIVEERNGSVEADYSIRVLQSRKKLIAAVPVKDPATGSMRTKVFSVEARAAFMEATTAGSLNHENATRCFELTMDESVAQTRRIHERQRLARTERGLELRAQADAIVHRHWHAQRLLAPAPVVIPYADRLTFPAEWMRTRRDHARFLNLIEVSAFLHQHQRERRAGAIVANLADYSIAYDLAGHALQESLSDIKRPLREAFAQVRDLSLKGDGTVSRREIREALALPDSTVRRWLADLVELEYLEADGSKGGQGKSTRYRLSERAPHDVVLGLLTPDQLASQLGT